MDSDAETADMDSSLSGCSRQHRAEQSSRWRHSRTLISHASSMAGKCDFHHLLSKTSQVNNPVDVFCSRVCKERIKHNRITPTGLGRIDTHTQMHKLAHPTLEKVAIVAQMPHLIFLVPLFKTTCLKFRRTENVAEVSVLLGKGELDDILSQITETELPLTAPAVNKTYFVIQNHI